MGDQIEGQDAQSGQEQGQQGQGTAPSLEDLQRQVKALTEKNQELLGTLRRTKDVAGDSQKKLAENEVALKKLNELAKLMGLDPVKEDPETLRQRREAEARSQEIRATKVEKAVLKGLAGLGKSLPEEVLDMVTSTAVNSSQIGLDESGNATGVKEFLEKVLPHFAGAGAGTVTPMPKPATPAGGQASMGDHGAPEINTYADIFKRGPAFAEEFRAKHPDRFALLRQTHLSSLANPSTPRLITQNGPKTIRA